jgi:hypothetical protein
MSQPAKSNLHLITSCATNSCVFGLFLGPLRLVAVIFKGRYGTMSDARGVLSNRALASVSLYLIGEGFVMGVRSGSHWRPLGCTRTLPIGMFGARSIQITDLI